MPEKKAKEKEDDYYYEYMNLVRTSTEKHSGSAKLTGVLTNKKNGRVFFNNKHYKR